MGVVSGIVMTYQFGTNWWCSPTGRAGDRAADGLRGADRLLPRGGVPGRHAVRHEPGGARLHFVATARSRVGTLISAFWILSANSWMQTPAGFAMTTGQFVPADWLAVIFNPSFPYRLVHMVFAAYLTTALWSAGSAPGTCCASRDNRRRARHVLDGDVDGGAGGAAAVRRRRPPGLTRLSISRPRSRPWKATSRATRRRAAAPVRHPRHGGRADHYAVESRLGSLILAHRMDAASGARQLAARGLAAACRSCSGASASWWAWAADDRARRSSGLVAALARQLFDAPLFPRCAC